ncbi:MAG: PEP-CTERM sorting domain-containing protein [Acidobacteria bacterium]|nr:PEP-CTERM sorting domain-containing protein [Acidobacteriota bacterium]
MLRFQNAVGFAGTLALACATLCQAGVATFATTAFGDNRHSGTGSGYSQTYAATAATSGGPVYSGQSFPSPGDCGPLCLISGFNEYGEASIEAATGHGRSYARSVFSGTFGALDAGFAEAGFTLTDTLEVDFSSPLFLTLDLSLANHAVSAGSGENEFAVWSAVYEATFTAVGELFPSLQVRIGVNRSLDAGVLDTFYRIGTIDDSGTHEIESGDFLPDRYHVKVEVPNPDFVPFVSYNLELTMYVHATCQTFGAPGCNALVSSPNSSYISLDGNYTSQNGYGYAGVVDAVPEPSTMALFGAAFVLLAVTRGVRRAGTATSPIRRPRTLRSLPPR